MSLLHAALQVHREGIMDLPAAVRLITLNAARAVGIDHVTGSIEPGKTPTWCWWTTAARFPRGAHPRGRPRGVQHRQLTDRGSGAIMTPVAFDPIEYAVPVSVAERIRATAIRAARLAGAIQMRHFETCGALYPSAARRQA
jgi:hypothetical protein